MKDRQKIIDIFLEKQHDQWRAKAYERLCRDHACQLRSDYELWVHNADQKKPPKPYRNERYPENPGMRFRHSGTDRPWDKR